MFEVGDLVRYTWPFDRENLHNPQLERKIGVVCHYEEDETEGYMIKLVRVRFPNEPREQLFGDGDGLLSRRLTKIEFE